MSTKIRVDGQESTGLLAGIQPWEPPKGSDPVVSVIKAAMQFFRETKGEAAETIAFALFVPPLMKAGFEDHGARLLIDEAYYHWEHKKKELSPRGIPVGAENLLRLPAPRKPDKAAELAAMCQAAWGG